MDDWPLLVNFFMFLLLPCGIVFGLLFWVLYGKHRRLERRRHDEDSR